MKVTIAAIGKMKDASPEAMLLREYIKRLSWKITIKECKDDAGLLAACAGCEKLIALDERGRDMGSRELAAQFSAWQQQGISTLGIAIGGAGGLHKSVRDKAHLLLAFGRATWPHMLVRAMLAEQLYRASTIMDGHPYHRD
ncbi:MAG: 23S rRNA (pseudouridine(1915)-N(3))-methyltransferase RlmH [Alphaproteobacteria bacterium]|nr:23S rRNA (pseudouridine(1915)-N(3))-methyltransferase RlmH [Alphaproteobacteria bacterium]